MNLTLDSSIFVMLSPKEVTYQGAVDLAQYYVKNTTMSAEEELVVVKVTLMKKYMNRKKMKVTLGRRILSNLLTVYVPTLLLNIIALSTNYFKVSCINIHYTKNAPFFGLAGLFLRSSCYSEHVSLVGLSHNVYWK